MPTPTTFQFHDLYNPLHLYIHLHYCCRHRCDSIMYNHLHYPVQPSPALPYITAQPTTSPCTITNLCITIIVFAGIVTGSDRVLFPCPELLPESCREQMEPWTWVGATAERRRRPSWRGKQPSERQRLLSSELPISKLLSMRGETSSRESYYVEEDICTNYTTPIMPPTMPQAPATMQLLPGMTVGGVTVGGATVTVAPGVSERKRGRQLGSKDGIRHKRQERACLRCLLNQHSREEAELCKGRAARGVCTQGYTCNICEAKASCSCLQGRRLSER